MTLPGTSPINIPAKVKRCAIRTDFIYTYKCNVAGSILCVYRI